MNGAIADPLVKTIRMPNINSTTITGSNQNFFLSLRKDHKSCINSIGCVGVMLIRFFNIRALINVIPYLHYGCITLSELF